MEQSETIEDREIASTFPTLRMDERGKESAGADEQTVAG